MKLETDRWYFSWDWREWRKSAMPDAGPITVKEADLVFGFLALFVVDWW